MCRCEKLGPSSDWRICSASLRWSKLWSGSPIPMKTRLVSGRLIASPSLRATSRLTVCTWATISAAVRLRSRPRVPVMQNLQAIAHPTCVETQSVFRSVAGM